MKKFLLIVVATMFVGTISAQDWQKNIFGIRVGANLSNLTFKSSGSISGDIRPNFHAGFNYERLLLNNIPLYIESGLYYSNKGYKLIDYDEKHIVSFNYVEIPLMVNYKFRISDFTLYPSAGVYYAYGISGKETYRDEYEGGAEVEEYDAFGEDGEYNRSDFGYRIGISATYKNFVLGVGYEHSLLNVCNAKDFDGDIKASNSNIFISVGYNF